MYIDTHAHTYDEVFREDLKDLVKKCESLEVNKVFLPNVDSSSIKPIFDLQKQYPNHFYPLMGLHPCYVKENYQEELTKIEETLEQRRDSIFGIGETGLDFYWDLTFKKEQIISLQKQIEWSFKYKLPLILHTRNSTTETFEVVSNAYKEGLKGIFHCYSGTMEEANEILKLKDFYFGIGGSITYKNSQLPNIVAQLPLEKLVLETDAPYLPPVPYRGKRNESSYIPLIASKIAEIKGVSIDEIKEVTTRNAKEIFLF